MRSRLLTALLLMIPAPALAGEPPAYSPPDPPAAPVGENKKGLPPGEYLKGKLPAPVDKDGNPKPPRMPFCGCGVGCDCEPQCGCQPAADPSRSAMTVTFPNALGSGTCVWCDEGYALILTNKHVWACPGEPAVEHAGKRYAAQRYTAGAAESSDLGLLWVEATIPAAAIAGDDPVPGTRVRHWGVRSGGGSGQVVGTFAPVGEVASITASYQSASGDSGAGVFNDAGQLVGVNWGFVGVGSGPVAFVPNREVRRFLHAVAGARFPRLRAFLDRLKPKPPAVTLVMPAAPARQPDPPAAPKPAAPAPKAAPAGPPVSLYYDPRTRSYFYAPVGGCAGGTCPTLPGGYYLPGSCPGGKCPSR